jgi:hypothetical protein
MAASALAMTVVFCSAAALAQDTKPLELNQPVDDDLAPEA